MRGQGEDGGTALAGAAEVAGEAEAGRQTAKRSGAEAAGSGNGEEGDGGRGDAGAGANGGGETASATSVRGPDRGHGARPRLFSADGAAPRRRTTRGAPAGLIGRPALPFPRFGTRAVALGRSRSAGRFGPSARSFRGVVAGSARPSCARWPHRDRFPTSHPTHRIQRACERPTRSSGRQSAKTLRGSPLRGFHREDFLRKRQKERK